MARRISRRVWIAIAAVLLLALAVPTWSLAAATWSRYRHTVPGQLLTVSGYRMHIHCTGSGSPAVVLEAAATATWLAWRRVQPQLSQLTRVCSYDRAGHGWSDPRPGPRDADHIVTELHELLDRAGVQRPIVLAGHSAGGLYVREYARRFPAEVSGVALLDASTPQQLDTLPGWRASYEKSRREYPARLRREKLRVLSGWERLTGNCSADSEGESPEIAAQYAALMCRPAFVGGEDSEYVYFEESSRQAARLSGFGSIPVLIVSRDPAVEKNPSEDIVARERAWDREQEGMKALSPRSWRVIATGGGHGVHHGRLELVVAELRALVEHVRGGAAPPFGTTAKK